MNNDNKLKHLEFIQNTITRMASNSFMLKGWCITIVSALIALSTKESDYRMYLAAFIPTIMFWILDSYYLWLEKAFRDLYKDVSEKDEQEIDFQIPINDYKHKKDFFEVLGWNITTTGFYGAIMVLLLLICIIA